MLLPVLALEGLWRAGEISHPQSRLHGAAGDGALGSFERMRRCRMKRVLVLCAVAAWLGGAGPAAAQSMSPDDRGRIEQVIHDYLLRHPEVLIEALKVAEAQDKQKQE